MKGGSPVSRKRQAELEIEGYLRHHLADSGGVPRSVLLRHLGESLLKADYDQPLAPLALSIPRVLASEQLLADFVREGDAEWGREYDERPYFQEPDRPPQPDDPYTIDSVRLTLFQLHETRVGRDGNIPAASDLSGGHVLTLSALDRCFKARVFLLS
jgi:hypothetical protein